MKKDLLFSSPPGRYEEQGGRLLCAPGRVEYPEKRFLGVKRGMRGRKVRMQGIHTQRVHESHDNSPGMANNPEESDKKYNYYA
jgi:hypothetical protein